MRNLFRVAVAARLIMLAPAVLAQTVTVTGSHLQDSTNTPVASATISFAPVSNSGQPISYRAGSGGQVITQPVTATVTNGAFSLTLHDTSVTMPTNVCYNVTAVDNETGESLLGTGYSCVQPTSVPGSGWCSTSSGVTTCNFDEFTPNTTPLTLSVAGQAATVDVGTVTTSSPGGAAQVVNVGNNHAAVLNITLPQGQQGIQGVPGAITCTAPNCGTNGDYVVGGNLTGGEIEQVVYVSATESIQQCVNDAGAGICHVPKGNYVLTGNPTGVAVGSGSSGGKLIFDSGAYVTVGNVSEPFPFIIQTSNYTIEGLDLDVSGSTWNGDGGGQYGIAVQYGGFHLTKSKIHGSMSNNVGINGIYIDAQTADSHDVLIDYSTIDVAGTPIFGQPDGYDLWDTTIDHDHLIAEAVTYNGVDVIGFHSNATGHTIHNPKVTNNVMDMYGVTPSSANGYATNAFGIAEIGQFGGNKTQGGLIENNALYLHNPAGGISMSGADGLTAHHNVIYANGYNMVIEGSEMTQGGDKDTTDDLVIYGLPVTNQAAMSDMNGVTNSVMNNLHGDNTCGIGTGSSSNASLYNDGNRMSNIYFSLSPACGTRAGIWNQVNASGGSINNLKIDGATIINGFYTPTVVISNATGSGSAQTATFTFTTTLQNFFWTGEVLTMYGYTGDLSYLNSLSPVVTSVQTVGGSKTVTTTLSTWNGTTNVSGTYTGLTGIINYNHGNGIVAAVELEIEESLGQGSITGVTIEHVVTSGFTTGLDSFNALPGNLSGVTLVGNPWGSDVTVPIAVGSTVYGVANEIDPGFPVRITSGIVQANSYSVTVGSASIAASSCYTYNFTATGIPAGASISPVSYPSPTLVTGGSVALTTGGVVSSANNVALTFCNSGSVSGAVPTGNYVFKAQ